jgi:hypothetical protein
MTRPQLLFPPAKLRPLTLEQAMLLHRIGRLYRFGVPDLS